MPSATGFQIDPPRLNDANVDGSICHKPEACWPNTAVGFCASGLPPDSFWINVSSAPSQLDGEFVARSAARTHAVTLPPSWPVKLTGADPANASDAERAWSLMPCAK